MNIPVHEQKEWYKNLLIYDVGMNKCQDTDYYLKKGFKVIAIEADPVLCDYAVNKYQEQIASGQLIVLNIGIADKEGELTFYVNQVLSEWSSFHYELAARDGHECKEIQVKTENLQTIFDRYGAPYYLKIDIEGMDQFALVQALNSDVEIPYISVENGSTMLPMLRDAGYDAFQHVQQNNVHELTHSKPATEGKYIDYKFVYGASGKFGKELDGSWCDYETAYLSVSRVWNVETGEKNPDWNDIEDGWFDLHARHHDYEGAIASQINACS